MGVQHEVANHAVITRPPWREDWAIVWLTETAEAANRKVQELTTVFDPRQEVKVVNYPL